MKDHLVYKSFVLTLTLLSIIPASAMRVSKQLSRLRMLAPKCALRGYALMSKDDFAQLLRNEKGDPLKPEEFAAKLAHMQYSTEDLQDLRHEHLKVTGIHFTDLWPFLDDVTTDEAPEMHARNIENLKHVQKLLDGAGHELIKQYNEKLRAVQAGMARRNRENGEVNQELPHEIGKKHD